MINALAIAALLAVPAAAPAAAPPCLPRQALADAFVVMSPYVVRAARENCTAHLPADAFLINRGEALATRLQGEGAGLEGSAFVALDAFSEGKIPKIKEKAAMIKVMGGMIETMLEGKLSPQACAEASRMLEALSPLPGRNLGLAMASLMALSKVGADGKGPRVCENG